MNYAMIITLVAVVLLLVIIIIIRLYRKKVLNLEEDLTAQKVETAKAVLKKDRLENVMSHDAKVEEKLNEEYEKIDSLSDDDLLATANSLHRRP